MTRRALVASGLALLAGCGFEPVYGTAGEPARTLRSELASIELPEANDYRTFELRNALLEQINPTRASVPTRYRLDWRVGRRIENLAIQVDAVVTRQDLTLAATYALIDLADGSVVDRGRVQRTASFNIRREPFSDLVAREDAERRAAAAVAVALRQQLTAHFERQEGA